MNYFVGKILADLYVQLHYTSKEKRKKKSLKILAEIGLFAHIVPKKFCIA